MIFCAHEPVYGHLARTGMHGCVVLAYVVGKQTVEFIK